MHNISQLRTFVKNGWTIANRRNLYDRVGKKSFDELVRGIKSHQQPTPFLEALSDNVINHDSWKRFNELNYDVVQKYCTSQQSVNRLGGWDFWKIQYLADNSRPIEQVLEETPQYFPTINQYFGRPVNIKKGNWNSEKYSEFKKLDTGLPNRKIASGEISQDSELVQARKNLFKDLKPLGCDEIHYRGEIYWPDNQHFERLKSLKPGDIYEPKTNFWITNNPEYAEFNYGHPERKDLHGVVYEILCPKDAKIIQAKYATYHSKPFTEGIYPDNAKFKILESKMNDNVLRLKVEYLVD